MYNLMFKAMWLAIAGGSYYASDYYSIPALVAVTVFALYKWAVIELVECSVAGVAAVLEAEREMQAEIEYAESADYDPEELPVLNSISFHNRMREFEG